MSDDAGVDINQLSADQQAALEQYTAVTAQEVKDAVPLLQRSQWNVQVSKLAIYCQWSQLTGYPDSDRQVL